MLILSRIVGEQIVIGEDIVVTVLDVSQGRVRLGFDAPPEVKIDRLEIRKVKERVKAKP